MLTKPVETFTSTGVKYARQPEIIQALREGRGHPISLQVSPTNRCNLRCVFCSVDERQLNLEWPIDDLKSAIFNFSLCGIKTVEFSGGGDPTLYPHLSETVDYCKKLSLKLGMITNGILLKDVPRGTLEQFEWIRVSMVTLDYKKDLKLPDPWPENVVLGMSYVVGQINYTGGKTPYMADEYQKLKEVRQYAIDHGAKYIRVVPECFTPGEEKMRELHVQWKPLVEELGPPLFFQEKFQLQAHQCWMDSVKPWLHTDGYVYPCNSVSLNTEAHRDFDPKWRLCHWKDVINYYQNRGSGSLGFVNDICDRCTFTHQNTVISDLLTPMMHEDFV